MGLRRLFFGISIFSVAVFIYQLFIGNFGGSLFQKATKLRQFDNRTKHNDAVFKLSEFYRRKPHILMWTKVFAHQYYRIEPECPFVNRCTLSYDKRTLRDADAFFFASRYINLKNMPREKLQKPTALNVYFVSEAYENALRKHRLAEAPSNYFHWTMTFLPESELHFSYGGPWARPMVAIERGYSPVSFPFDAASVLADKRRPILWTVSNCNTISRRELAFKALQKYIDIDIIGKCSSDDTKRKMCPNNASLVRECDFFRQYYFLITVENVVCEHYISEKYWQRFGLPLIPIVMRRRIYENILPPHSFIAMDDYGSPAEMANYLHRLIKDAHQNESREYLKYFEWRRQGWAIPPKQSDEYRSGLCQLCEKLLWRKPDEMAPLKIQNVTRWYEEHSHCERDEFTRSWLNE